MKNWDDYRFILALHRSGTIRAAALQLGVTHSTVSRRIAVLNEKYDTPVFERTAGEYKATELGCQLVNAARNMEQIDCDTSRRQKAIGSDLSGPITLSLPGVLGQFLLLGPLTRFSSAHPDIKLTLQSSYRFANLDRSEADVVVRAVTMPPEHLIGRRLFPYALNYYCRYDYLQTTKPADRQWITDISAQGQMPWLTQSPFPTTPVGLRIDDIMLRHHAALMGRGMIRGACYMSDPEPQLIRLPNSPSFPGQDLWVLTHPDLKNTPRIKLLMQFLITTLLEKRDLIEGRHKKETSTAE